MEKKILVMMIVAFLVGTVLGYAGGSASTPSIEPLQEQISDLEAQTQSLQSEITELEALLGPVKKGAWNPITTFEGASEVTTDYFYVAGTDLRFNWTWTSTAPEYAAFSITLYKEGETTYTEMYAFLEDEGTNYAHNIVAAYYYLDISTANLASWNVTIEQWIPET